MFTMITFDFHHDYIRAFMSDKEYKSSSVNNSNDCVSLRIPHGRLCSVHLTFLCLFPKIWRLIFVILQIHFTLWTRYCMCMQMENLTKQIISPMLKDPCCFYVSSLKILISCKIITGHNTTSTI